MKACEPGTIVVHRAGFAMDSRAGLVGLKPDLQSGNVGLKPDLQSGNVGLKPDLHSPWLNWSLCRSGFSPTKPDIPS
jgi:hypothetical protein